MKIPTHHLRLVLAALAALALTGCPTIRMPNWEHPGSAGQQRYEALQFDPYPLDDVAPAVAGSRPREYDRPIPEVKRGQTFTPKRPNIRPVPMPAFGLPAAPATTTAPLPSVTTVSPFPPSTSVPYQAPPPVVPPPPVVTTPPPVVTTPSPW